MSNKAKWRSVWGGVAILGVLLVAESLWQIPLDFVIYDKAGEFRQYHYSPWLSRSLESLESWFHDSRFIGVPLLLVGLVAFILTYLAPSLHHRMCLRWGRFSVAIVAMVACAGAALFIPSLWPGVSGRDLRPPATTLALLIMVLAVVFRWGRQWDIWDFLFIAVGSEFVTLLIISHFSGFTWLELFHWFNLHWLLFMTAFTVVPWFLGFGLGSVPRLWQRGDILRNAQQDAAPNGGPATPVGNSGATEGPPSVS
jgi:hypothetical protein